MRTLILSLFLILLPPLAHATTVYPWNSQIGSDCSSVSTGTDHMLCLDNSKLSLYKCKSSDGTCNTAVNGYQWTGSSSAVTTSVNVGIGSTVPGATLDVDGTVRLPLSNNNLLITNGNIGLGVTPTLNRMDNAGGEALGTYAGVKTAGTGNLIVSGNVGIGTWVPSNSFTVSGNSNMTGILSLGTTTTTYRDSNGGADNSVGFMVSGYNGKYQGVDAGASSQSWNFIQDNTAGGANHIRFANINGIMTSTTAGSESGDLRFGTKGTGDTGPQERLRITSVGNVGIGSTVPGQALDVQGTIRINGFSPRLQINGTNTPGFEFYKSGIRGWLVYPDATSNAFIWKTNTNLRMSLLQSGDMALGGNITDDGVDINGATMNITGSNVGIGSTVPGQKLDVQGTIRAISGGTCTTLYRCQGGADAGIIQTVACTLCPTSTCVPMNGCF